MMSMLRGLTFAGLVAVAASAGAADLTLDTPRDNLRVMRQIQCSLKDGEVVTWYWRGHAYSRVPGEPDRQLFAVEGMNIRQCGPLGTADDGSFKMTTREILLYEDPKTGAVLRTWTNPWTGKEVKVVHVANDPVNQRLGTTDRAGRPFRLPLTIVGNQWWMTSTVPLFYRNPLAGDYQDFIGGKYHATEMFNFFGDVDQIANARRTSVDARVGWVRMSDWLPWMEMGGRAGLIYFSTAGRRLDRFDDISETLKAEIRSNYPEYTAPPPLDDERPNETSWTYFRKVTPVAQ
ncbi:MAG: DUF1838 domain-containing protein [Gammaproteobacteria bacterium]|nr:DUF1838 domain-containing protein [Gammaproteobacteria bacterium]